MPVHARGEGTRLTLWQVSDITRERTREIETVNGLEVDARLLRQPAAGVVCSGPRRAHRPRQRHAVALAAPAAGNRARAHAARHRAGGRCSPDPRRCTHRRTPNDTPRARPAARGRPRLPGPARLPGARAQGHHLRAGARPQRGAHARRGARARRNASHARVPVGAVRHRHRRRRWEHRHLQLGFHAHVRGRGPWRAVNARGPRARRRGGGRPRDRQGARARRLGARGGVSHRGLVRVQARADAAHLCQRAQRRAARPRGRRALRHRCHRAEGARAQVRAEPQDGGRRQACRWRGARLQQRADRHHRLLRPAAADAPADRSRLPRHHEHQEQRQSRGEPGAAAARLLASPDAAARGAGARRDSHRSGSPPQPHLEREDRAQDPARPRPVARQGRPLPVRQRHRQSRRQCPGRHARRRLASRSARAT